MKPAATIAIVGMAGRFPGAHNIAEFWQNLRDGVESIRDRSDVELIATGATNEELANPEYVKRASLLDDVAMFDASFFGLSPRDASIMDPQHRHFLECTWEALEDAGHPPQRFRGSVGVFAGSGLNSYLIHNLLANRRLLESAGLFQLKQTGNDKDVLATRVSYQLDLRGPSINVQTACSTSLVAVHLACQSLLNHECDMALAGGVTIEIPHGLGYIFREGEILSRDGHCRSFDAASSGTIFGSGVGVVVLRRLEDALEDRDHVRAVILASAINNDGARKVGYLAPSVEGQCEVIAEALDVAGVGADDISYVEAHGTGTVVGDPIEVRALTRAFRKTGLRNGYCAIGSLKSNVGHLDAAAGVGGLIKTVLALEHGQLPPSLHFKNPNPHIELKDSPFFVNSKLANWPRNGTPRRAGVTALGIGGTNAHVVLEEAPKPVVLRQKRPHELLLVSAKTGAGADRALAELAGHLRSHPEVNLADVAFTCQVGRHAFQHRRALVIEETAAAIVAFGEGERKGLASTVATNSAPQIAFMFSGQGSQYVNMGREFYEHEPVFRDSLDLCADHLLEFLGLDLRTALYPPERERDAASEKLNQTWLTQPALFSIEYSLARWWMSLGIAPAAMVGHSIGEYVAACLAGVFSLNDALDLVAFRGRLIYGLPSGSMLAVPLPAAELHLNGTLSLAAVNNPRMCVVSGPTVNIASFEKELSTQSVTCRRLFTSHAFHSAMMDPILESFERRLSEVEFQPPRSPYLSNVSGTWIKDSEATDPAYWARHIRQTVRFSDCLAELLGKADRVLIEVGPGNALTSLAREQGGPSARAFQSLPHPRETISDLRGALQTLGQVWTLGADVNWERLHALDSVQRIPLPTYAFEHQRFWIEPDRRQAVPSPPVASTRPDDSDQLAFYRRVWKPTSGSPVSIEEGGCWIVFNDSLGLGDRIAAGLRKEKQEVILVAAGSKYQQPRRGKYTIRPSAREDYDALIADVIKNGYWPTRILHLWSVESKTAESSLEETLNRSFYSPLYLAQALAAQDISSSDIGFISNRLQRVSEEPIRNPARAVLFGPARVIPKELPEVTCRNIDVDMERDEVGRCAAEIITEMTSRRENSTVAFRNGDRFVEAFDELRLGVAPGSRRLERGGVYLITGGLGGIGLVIAEHLARDLNARLVLVSRSAAPVEAQWEASLDDVEVSEAKKQLVRKLIEIRSSAAGLLVVKGDVTDRTQMRNVVALARQRFGKVDGVFHAAGVLDDGPLMLKTASSAAKVLDPKIRGTLVLEEVFREMPLKCFVLFSSVSAIFPPPGQVDYASANAFLDAFALSRGGGITAINWGAWRDVGMAARFASTHPWLERRLLETPTEIVYASALSSERHWCLTEHRLKNGKALVPGTSYLEMVAAAFSRGSFHGAIEFRDVFFLAPLTCDRQETREVRVHLKSELQGETERGAFHFSISAKEGEWVEHASGQIAACLTRAASWVNRSIILARCNEREIEFGEGHRTKQERFFEFGPRWHCLKSLHVAKGEGLAELELDAKFVADCSSFRMHPALLDLATGCALYLTDGYEEFDGAYLPFSYKRLCVYRALPAKLFSHIRHRQDGPPSGEFESFDRTLVDEHDEVIAEIESFTMRRIGDPANSEEKREGSEASVHSEESERFEAFDRSGIKPIEGVQALTRILLSAAPASMIAVSQPLEGLDQVDTAPSSRAMGSASSNTSPPSEDVESTLMLWWQDLLGVVNVGLDDDFFSLGGHSLIGVRLFAKIKKEYKVDLELAVLFESRTVRQLSELIRKAAQPAAGEVKTWSTLVPIQPRGSRIPLFCIHAIGGDVLFYEKLAKALGPDQPFCAFHSLLLSRAEISETSVEELAAAYVKEMREFYPTGPYLVGGLSFGGLVAYEMSQQLLAQGVDPGLLIFFDTSVPGSAVRVKTGDQLSNFGQNFREKGIDYLLRKARLKKYYWKKVLRERVQGLACTCYRLAGMQLTADLRYYLVGEAHSRAMKAYKVRPYPERIALLRVKDRNEILSKREDPNLGWGEFASGGLEIYDVPADHGAMLLEPYVQEVARILKTILPS